MSKKICKISVRVDEKMYQELTEKAKAYQCTISDVVITRLKNDSLAIERERVYQSVMKVAVLLEKQESLQRKN